jgi:outer membrane protein assembly factor BamB
VRNPDSADPEIVTAAYQHFDGYSARTGKHAWSHSGLAAAVVASPVFDGGTVYAFSYGYETDYPFDDQLKRLDRNGDGVLQAAEIEGESWHHQIAVYKGNRDGHVTREEWDEEWARIKMPSSLVALSLDPSNPSRPAREIWRYEKSFIGVVPSPLLYDGVLYVARNGGILTAFDARSGAVLKAGRLRDAIESYFASPVAASGKLYFVSEAGKVVVVKAGRDWDVLGVYPLGEESHATPALSQGRLFIRTAGHLYCFASPAP